MENLAKLPSNLWSDDLRDDIDDRFSTPIEREIAHKFLDVLEPGPGTQALPGLPQYQIPSVQVPRFASMGATSSAVERQTLAQEESGASSDLRSAEIEFRHVQQALDAQSSPQGLLNESMILAAITVFGVAVPLARMTFGDDSVSDIERIVYAALFMISLVIFFGYLLVTVRQLSKPTTGEKDL